MKVAKAFSGEDPDGLSARARELKGDVGDGGAGSLGRSLKNLSDSFGNLFRTITDDGDPATDTMNEFATALNNVAKGINTIASAYRKGSDALNWFSRNVETPVQNFLGVPQNQRGTLGSRAAGGSVMAGQAVRVGEFGSEIFVPSGSGSIRKDPGNGGNTFIFNGVVDGESARRSIERVLQSSARRTGAVNFAGANL
jgi:hypothetical protein